MTIYEAKLVDYLLPNNDVNFLSLVLWVGPYVERPPDLSHRNPLDARSTEPVSGRLSADDDDDEG